MLSKLKVDRVLEIMENYFQLLKNTVNSMRERQSTFKHEAPILQKKIMIFGVFFVFFFIILLTINQCQLYLISPQPLSNFCIFSYIFARYFWLFKVSYLWYAPIGFTITLFGGWLLSIIFELIHLEGTPTIYLDNNRKVINADLFSPPVARRLRLRNAKYLETEFNVGNFQLS